MKPLPTSEAEAAITGPIRPPPPVPCHPSSLLAFRNRHRGKRAFIIGNGPSLRVADLDRLRGEITFACNKIYLAYPETGWRPTYYAVEDVLVARNNADKIRELGPYPKFFASVLMESAPTILKCFEPPERARTNHGEHGGTQAEALSLSYIFPFRHEGNDVAPSFSFNATEVVYCGNSIVYSMLQLAAFMGIREVYLLGVDYRFAIPSTNVGEVGAYQVYAGQGEQNHFHPDYRESGEEWIEPKMERMRLAFLAARKAFESVGGRLLNASRDTDLDVLDRVDFDFLMKEDRSQRSEVRGQNTEGRRQKSEDEPAEHPPSPQGYGEAGANNAKEETEKSLTEANEGNEAKVCTSDPASGSSVEGLAKTDTLFASLSSVKSESAPLSRPFAYFAVKSSSSPLWSVMIPTYNSAATIAETLRSVLDQAPPESEMQIEVIDDASTDTTEEVVRSIGGDRVTFFRQPRNSGAIRNFNTCITRARGELIHILHGDDYVRPGFYAQMQAMATAHPEASLLACAAMVVDKEDREISVSIAPIPTDRPITDPSICFYRNWFKTPGMVIRRSFYEAFGGFDENLIHTADWEMWTRAIANGGCIYTDRILACYREWAGNDTSLLSMSGDKIYDYLRLGNALARKYPGFDLRQFLAMCRQTAEATARQFLVAGREDAAAQNALSAMLIRDEEARMGGGSFVDDKPQSVAASQLTDHVRNTWQLLLARDGIRRLVVYGAGKHSQWLEPIVRDVKGPEVVAVFDDAPRGDLRLWGQAVTNPRQLENSQADAVLLSTDTFLAKMKARAAEFTSPGIKLVSLYGKA